MKYYYLFQHDSVEGLMDELQENLYICHLDDGYIEKIKDIWEVFSAYNNLTWNRKYKGILVDGLEDNGFIISYISKEGNTTAYNRDIEHYIFVKIEGGAKDE